MKYPTHWMPDCLKPDEWPDDPSPYPEEAARMLLEIPEYDNFASWDAWDDLQSQGHVDITVRGFIETDEIIEDEESRFEGYEPGETWFKATDEIRTVRVTLNFQVRT